MPPVVLFYSCLIGNTGTVLKCGLLIRAIAGAQFLSAKNTVLDLFKKPFSFIEYKRQIRTRKW
jgi:hypothetical protein